MPAGHRRGRGAGLERLRRMGQRRVFLDHGKDLAGKRRGLLRGFLKRNDELPDGPSEDGLVAPPRRRPRLSPIRGAIGAPNCRVASAAGFAEIQVGIGRVMTIPIDEGFWRRRVLLTGHTGFKGRRDP